jgi:hypothetical protein
MRDEAFLPTGRLRKPGMPFAALWSRAAPALYALGIGLSRRSNWFIFASPVFNWSGGLQVLAPSGAASHGHEHV